MTQHDPFGPSTKRSGRTAKWSIRLGRSYSTGRHLHLLNCGISMESTPVAIPPSPEILSLEQALTRARQAKQGLIAAGLPTARNIRRRLAWKRSRGD